MIQKSVEEIGNLTGNKTGDKITKVSRTSLENNSEIVANKEEDIGFDREIPKERYISPDKKRSLLMICDGCNGIIMEYQKVINLLGNTLNHSNEK